MIRIILVVLLVLVALGLANTALAGPDEKIYVPPFDKAWKLAQETDPDLLIEAAQRASRENRHRDAIRAYERAATLAPERRPEIFAELGFQYAWAGELGLASKAFEHALAKRPRDFDLRMGELLVRNWRGDHLSAWSGYRALRRLFPRKPELLIGMASAQNWLGRRDLALASLDAVQELDPDNRDAGQMEASIRGSLRPSLGLFYDWSEDSDDYQVNAFWAELSLDPHQQLEFLPFVNVIGFRRPGAAAIDETWVGATLAARPATRLGLWGRVGVLTNPADGESYGPWTARAAADYLVADRLQLGVSTERFAILSFNTLPDKVTGRSWGASLTWRPDWLTRVQLAGDVADYDAVDNLNAGFQTNNRVNLHADVSREIWLPWRLRAGVSGRYLDFERFQNIGIWNPDDFWSLAGTLGWQLGPRERWGFAGGFELGPARESGGDLTLFASYRASYYHVIEGLQFELGAGHSEGNVETGNGFDRTFAHLGVRRRF